MTQIPAEVLAVLNQSGRIGALGTADKYGQPNIAYFGTLRPMPDGTITVALTNNKTLKNLADNPLAVLFLVKDAPVTIQTPGYRLYLKVLSLHNEGPFLAETKEFVSKHVSPQAAGAVSVGVIFEVTGVRALVDMA